jgi:hypothetical protein
MVELCWEIYEISIGQHKFEVSGFSTGQSLNNLMFSCRRTLARRIRDSCPSGSWPLIFGSLYITKCTHEMYNSRHWKWATSTMYRRLATWIESYKHSWSYSSPHKVPTLMKIANRLLYNPSRGYSLAPRTKTNKARQSSSRINTCNAVQATLRRKTHEASQIAYHTTSIHAAHPTNTHDAETAADRTS